MDPADLIGELADDDATIPDVRELLAYINQQFRGTKEYARIVVDDVNAAPQGSTQRLSFHNNYLGAIAKYGGDDDLSGVDKTALEAERDNLVRDEAERLMRKREESDSASTDD